jgi:hypothetical protein
LELKLKNDMGMVGFMVKMQRRKEQFWERENRKG